jgi:hypothetical protein
MGINNQGDYDETKPEREEYIKKLKEEYNMEHIANFFPLAMETIFGVNSIVVDHEKEALDQKRAFVPAQTPVVAMAMYWESMWQQMLAQTIQSMGEMILQVIKASELEEVPVGMIEGLLEAFSSAEGVKAALQAFYESTPDILSIGNPMLIGNVVAKTAGEMGMPDAVEDLLADIFKNVELKTEEE